MMDTEPLSIAGNSGFRPLLKEKQDELVNGESQHSLTGKI